MKLIEAEIVEMRKAGRNRQELPFGYFMFHADMINLPNGNCKVFSLIFLSFLLTLIMSLIM